MSFWGALRGLFIARTPGTRLLSPFEGDPEQARKERPIQPSTTTRWYQQDIERAIREADAGDMRTPAQLCRSFCRDGAIGGLVATRTGGLMRLPKHFRGTPSVVAELETHETLGVGGFDQVASPKELEAIDRDGLVLGVGIGELLDIPGRRWPVFVRLNPEFLQYRWAEDRWYYRSEAGLLPITPGDGRWVLHTPGGYQEPWASGLWPALSRAFVSKDHAFHYRENYAGKLANPARVAIAPNGATEAQKQGWFQKVMAWGVNTVFGMTPGYDVKLLESNGRGFEIFQQTIETCDREIMIALAGQIVTVTGGSGFANANIHALIRSDLVQGDGDALAYTVNSQILAPIVNRFFGWTARASVQWDTRPPPALESEAKAIIAAADAIERVNTVLAPYGMRVDAREIVTRYRIPVVGEAPLVVEPSPDDIVVDPIAEEPASAEELPAEEPSVTEALAAKMTEHAVPQCEHGSKNRCWLCGIERVRDFEPGADGLPPQWSIKWRSIAPEVAA